MKIAIVIDRIEPFYRGGYERRAWELARRLVQRHEVTVFTSAPSDQDLEGVRVQAVCRNWPYFKSDGFRDLRMNAIFSIALLRYLAQSRDFDVIDCNATPFLHIFPAALLARKWKSTFIVTAHEALASTMDGYFRARKGALPRLKAWAARYVYYRSQRTAQRLVGSSAVTAENLRKEGFLGVEVCAGGIDSCLGPKSSYLGRAVFVGRLVPNKKVDVLLRGFALAKEQGVAESLTIIGDGPERPRLELLAKQLGVAMAVSFLGDTDDTRKLKVVSGGSDVFVSASLREGFSLAALEALSAGNPAIISHQSQRFQNGSTEYVRHGFNGIITDGTPASIANALRQVACQPELYRSLSQNAVDTASLYAWDNVVPRLEDIYARAISNRYSSKPVEDNYRAVKAIR